MIISIAIVMVLGYIGFTIAFNGINEPHSPGDILYYTLQLFVLQSGTEVPVNNIILQIARFIAPIIILSTSAIIIWIMIDHIQKIRLKFLTNHIVVCGLGYLGKEIAYYYSKDKRVVVIEKDPEFSELSLLRSYGITVLIGDATKKEMLHTARIGKANHIYLVTGKDDLNIEIAVKCEEIISKSPSQPVCGHIHLENKDLWQAFNVFNKDRSQNLAEGKNKGQFYLDFFNLYQIAGFCMLRDHSPFTDEQREEGHAHILVLGLGRMGEALILRIIRAWENAQGPNSKIRITCIDREGDSKRALFELHYQPLLSEADLSVLDIDLTSPDFLNGEILQVLHQENPITQVYVCIDNSALAITSAMNLIHHGFYDIPIILRSTYFDGIPKIFELLKKSNPLLANIETFPIISSKCCLDMIINGGNILRRKEIREILARAIHEQYLSMRIAKGAIMGTAPELLPWKKLSENLKESNRKQADHINQKLSLIGCGITILPDWPEPSFKFSPEEIEKLAEFEHKRFMEEREADGWILAEKKNIEKKESPYIIDYNQLPEEIKEYDRDVVRQIPAILARIGLKICREVVCKSS